MDRIFNIVDNNGIAEISLIGVIGSENLEFTANTAERMKAEIIELNKTNPTRINLKIASIGGNVAQVESMKQDLASTGIPLDIDYLDKSASAALAFGEIAENVRLPENQVLLIHEVRASGVDGTAEGLESAARTMRNMNANIIRGYVAQSKKTGKNKNADEFLDIMRRNDNKGEWLGADELLNLGLITEITPAYNFSNEVTNEILNKFGLPEFTKTIIINKQPKKMNLKDLLGGKSPNLLEVDNVKAIYNGKLEKGTDLVPTGGSELKNGTYEIEGFSVEITDNKITNYKKIGETKEAVNIADFKNEFETVQNTVQEIKDSNEESSKAQNLAIENLTKLVKDLSTELKDLKTEGSKIDLPNAENLGGGEDVKFDAEAEKEKLLAENQEKVNQTRNNKA